MTSFLLSLEGWALTASMEASSDARVSFRAMIEVLSSWRMTGDTSTLTLWPMTWPSSFCHSVLPALAGALAEAVADPPAVEPDGEAAPSLPLDVPGRSHPVSTGTPTPTRAERATKDRRDGAEGTQEEPGKMGDTRTPSWVRRNFSKTERNRNVILLASGAPRVLPIAPQVLPIAAWGACGSPGVPVGIMGTAQFFPVGVSPCLE